MSLQYYVNYSWIGLLALSPLSALLITCTLVSIHRNRFKSVLILAVLYAQLLFQILSFAYSIVTLLNLIVAKEYLTYMNYSFNALVFFKSLTVVSVQLEEYYKFQSPSNYILNVNSNWLKYHLLVLAILSLMGSYFYRNVLFLPILGKEEIEVTITYLSIHSIVIILSLVLLSLHYCLIARRKNLDLNIINCNGGGTNSTSSSAANLFGINEGQQREQERISTASILAMVNLLINVALILVSSLAPLLPFWLLPPLNWPLLLNVLLWSTVAECLLTSSVYWAITAGRKTNNSQRDSSSRYNNKKHNFTHNMLSKESKLYFNGEFTYFGAAAGVADDEPVLNNARPSSSAYNTFDDSFHQTRSYQDELKCGSVTTIANDDFEYHSSYEYGRSMVSFLAKHRTPLIRPQLFPTNINEQELPIQLNQTQGSPNTTRIYIDSNDNPAATSVQNNNATMIIRRSSRKSVSQSTGLTASHKATPSLSMNDLDLIEDCQLDEDTTAASSLSNQSVTRKRRLRRRSCNKYNKKKCSNGVKRRFTNSGTSKSLNRRCASLESLHSPNVNETQLAYLDTGQTVIIFTTEFL